MSDTQQTTHSRRSTDPILLEIRANQVEILAMLKAVSRAFPEDEFGEPDYAGHRRYHVGLIDSNRKAAEVREELVKKAVTTGGIGVASVVCYALWDYIKAALKG